MRRSIRLREPDHARRRCYKNETQRFCYCLDGPLQTTCMMAKLAVLAFLVVVVVHTSAQCEYSSVPCPSKSSLREGAPDTDSDSSISEHRAGILKRYSIFVPCSSNMFAAAGSEQERPCSGTRSTPLSRLRLKHDGSDQTQTDALCQRTLSKRMQGPEHAPAAGSPLQGDR